MKKKKVTSLLVSFVLWGSSAADGVLRVSLITELMTNLENHSTKHILMVLISDRKLFVEQQGC